MLCKNSKCSIEAIYAEATIEGIRYKNSSGDCNDMIIKGIPGIKTDGSQCLCECHVIGHNVCHVMPCCDKSGIKYMIEKNR